MGLKDIRGKRITASAAEEHPHVQNALNKWGSRTSGKVCDSIDCEIQKVVDHGGRLSWMNTGSLLGHGSGLPPARHKHLWRSVYALFPKDDPVAEKERLVTVGALVKWRIALRSENWLVHYRPTGKEDIITGEEIHAGEYWIAPSAAVMCR